MSRGGDAAARTRSCAVGPRLALRGVVLVLLLIGWLGAQLTGAPTATADGVVPLAAGSSIATASPLAAGSPFGGDEDAGSADGGASSGDPRPDRLARIAAELRRSRFVVDPELDWQYDGRTRRSVERALRGARIAVFVVALPATDEDESGGDLERVVQALQRRVGRPGLYVAIDQEGRMDLASVGVPLDLRISFSLLYPSRDDRPYEQQERDPAPAPWTTVPGRLGEMLAAVAKARPGPPNGIVDDVAELSSLPGEARDERNREDAIFGVVGGLLLGLVLAGVGLGIAAGVRSVRAAGPGRGPGGGGGAGTGGRPAAGGARSDRGARGSRSGRGRRRGRRGTGRRA
ncbi:unannotated protein [freshwater metagenome]|uniref:Unannotated protein n=1 Tax=freshwater metagenome TaxID=449393 RepID=A0A6J7HLG1_9ZZZZ|nr:hypothetical protein [Actinomycetota bacterium]